MMKKILIPAALAAALALTAVPVAAADLSNASTSGDTSVTGRVVDGSAGDVTYVISIPDKIDFGDLKQPADSYSYPIDKGATVKAETIKNLPEGSRVAVLVKDAADDGEDTAFRIVGQDTANSGKELTYTIKNNSIDANLQDGTRYANGYLVGLFQNGAAENDDKGDTVNLKLTLDQAQLFDKYIPEWAGNYKGTLNFYSTVASVGSFN